MKFIIILLAIGSGTLAVTAIIIKGEGSLPSEYVLYNAIAGIVTAIAVWIDIVLDKSKIDRGIIFFTLLMPYIGAWAYFYFRSKIEDTE